MLFFSGLVCFDYVSGGCRVFICYFLNCLIIYCIKFEKVDELYKNYVGDLLSLLMLEELVNMFELVKYEFNICEFKMDVVFFGLGWVIVNELGVKIVVYVLKGVSVLLCKFLI